LYPYLEGDRLFDRGGPANADEILEPYIHLRERLGRHGVEVHTADLLAPGQPSQGETNLYVTMGSARRYRELSRRSDTILSAFFVLECPIVEPRLFTEIDGASRSFRRFFSFAPGEALEPFLRRPLAFKPSRFPYPFTHVEEQAWANRERGFLTIINANKVPRLDVRELYTERLRAVRYFSQHGEIDLYGRGWDGPPFRVGTTRVPRSLRNVGYRIERQWLRFHPGRQPLLAAARRVWRGPVASTVETLGRYTFSICFENMVLDGWVTEKIFDSLRAGTIPVYLGAPDIDSWVWPECFIDMRRFSGYEELREFLHGLSPSKIETYREAGREYFGSDEFRPFTKQAFAEIFEQIVREDAGISL